MTPWINVVAASVIGREHRRIGKNNQDAVAWTDWPQGLVAVVCDGCGSQPHSEVGAQLGAQQVAQTVARQLEHTSLNAATFWQQVQQQLLENWRAIAAQLGGNLEATVRHYLLFTLLGVIVTPEATVIFGLGDGVYAVNGEIYTLGPYAHDAPPYLAYHLLPSEGFGSAPLLPLQVYCQRPTATVQTLLLGSDGVLDLIAAAPLSVPGKAEPVGDISQFWQDAYFQNPDRLRRRLTLINRDAVQPDWERQQLGKVSGLLPDDTTLICLRLHPRA